MKCKPSYITSFGFFRCENCKTEWGMKTEAPPCLGKRTPAKTFTEKKVELERAFSEDTRDIDLMAKDAKLDKNLVI